MTGSEQSSETGQQVTTGLLKLALALRQQAWQASGQQGLTPTQSQILALVASLGPGIDVSTVSEQIAITKGTASQAISTLVQKGLLRKKADPHDGRVVRLHLTSKGSKEAQRSSEWPDFFAQAVDTLPTAERAGFLRGLIGLIRSLQEQGSIPTSRMCVDCRFFEPHRYPGRGRPHHCHYLDAAIADTDLRIHCDEMEPADEPIRAELLNALFSSQSND